jgi:hypothetical protein
MIHTGAEHPGKPLGGICADITPATAFQSRNDRVPNSRPAGKFPLCEFAPHAQRLNPLSKL